MENQNIAQKRIEDFRRRYGEGALRLAYHAALPVVINAELLHLLRINFFLDSTPPLDYTAEGDLLLSPLCFEIGDGLYEIEHTIRDELLKGLLKEYGQERTREIAALLRRYTERHLPWYSRPALKRAQELTALDAFDPVKAALWLWETERSVEQLTVGQWEWFVAIRQEIQRKDMSLHQEKRLISLSRIWEQLQRVQQELKQGSRETQDTAITALQDALETCLSLFFPSFVYPLLTDVLHFYCRKVLPYMGIPAEDQRIVREEFEKTITHLNTQEHTAKLLESQLKQFFLHVKSGALDSIEDIVTVLCETLSSRAEKDKKFFQQIRVNPRHPRHLRSIPSSDRSLEKFYRAFKKSPFTESHVIPFFEAIIAQLPPEIKTLFVYMATLFWFQLHEFVHMKAVLVNTKTKEAQITRLDVTTSLESKGLDTLDFENTVDDRMYNSCWNAVQAARKFLEARFTEIIGDTSLCVKCRFQNPIAIYNDTSASLLVGLKVVGDVLDLAVDPQTVVSGEVNESGKILPVACVAEKVLAAQHHPDIQRLFLPADELFTTSRRVAITRVHDLSEAVVHYYGEQFRKKMKQLTRRDVPDGVAGDLKRTK